MFISAIVLMSIGTVGVFAAVGLEIKYKEPVYMIMMKIFPWFFGVGGILMGIALA